MSRTARSMASEVAIKRFIVDLAVRQAVEEVNVSVFLQEGGRGGRRGKREMKARTRKAHEYNVTSTGSKSTRSETLDLAGRVPLVAAQGRLVPTLSTAKRAPALGACIRGFGDIVH